MDTNDQTEEKRKTMSCGVYFDCPESLKEAIHTSFDWGFHFLVTQLTHPNFTKDFEGPDAKYVMGRTDRILKSQEWSRLVVGELSKDLNLDSEDEAVRLRDKEVMMKELGFASHLGVPAVLLYLNKPKNLQLARVVNDKLVSSFSFSVWAQMPMVHFSRQDPMGEEEQDTWDWWNDFRTLCDYDKRVGLVLEVPEAKDVPPADEVDRWIGEPVKALVFKASHFLINHYGKPVLPKALQDLVRRFMTIDVQYIIHLDVDHADTSLYVKYMAFLGKKLYMCDTMAEFVRGCEDYLQNPLQPLTEHLETTVYEVFEKDQVKYDYYQKAFFVALEKWEEARAPVVMVVGAGRGPLVQCVLNVSKTLGKPVKVYAVEKNPYAMNTIAHRNKYEWDSQVTLVREDMRTWQAPELADIMISELLGSFGDNELSPECLDGAQRFLRKPTGISIPSQYTSYLAPLQSVKLYNEIKNSRMPDKSVRQVFETPYVVHLANYYQLGEARPLFVFDHPNFQLVPNTRHKSIKYPPLTKAAVLTGFSGFFETVLHENVTLSTNPRTHTPDMVSWFPIVFPLPAPVQLKAGDVVRVSFWREENPDKVWYEWCLESPFKTPIMNPNGRSYSIKKH
ncbi:protein arginine N-methyltransferase 5 [Anthonomus grandis grandis]|uniref:protein arginine N-methyltransferase 5 n=1 Tax=Anthonomus grandis grandis TaxID=2921223 RepID=UPI0021652A4E|nr:protein arginine N-methyltransferase 5 [Anthonomus grandis grandis]XP_050312353.1 protein arginine N-methyltransferase 5 [Anthonomus grandis grandis]